MDATAWATVALIIFIAIVFYYEAPALVGKSLDERTAKIQEDLDEARRLREEAQALLADFQGKRKEAEKEAEEIIASAKHEATILADEAAEKTAEFVKRRTAMAEQKIEQAEASALAEVRASAVDVAIAAAGQLVAGKMSSAKSGALIKDSIADIKSKLN